MDTFTLRNKCSMDNEWHSQVLCLWSIWRQTHQLQKGDAQYEGLIRSGTQL